MAPLTKYDDSTSMQISMSEEQFQRLLRTVTSTVAGQAATLNQTADAMTPEQKLVGLQYRALRNGLGRVTTSSEGSNRTLIRIVQNFYRDGSELDFPDPIPDAAASLMLTINERRVPMDLPKRGSDGRLIVVLTELKPDTPVRLVEFLDVGNSPIAIGVPSRGEVDHRRGVAEAVTDALVEDVLESLEESGDSNAAATTSSQATASAQKTPRSKA